MGSDEIPQGDDLAVNPTRYDGTGPVLVEIRRGLRTLAYVELARERAVELGLVEGVSDGER